MSLVQCTHCRQVYDETEALPLENGEYGRYADCDVYRAPCCLRTVDNRTWKGLPDIRRLEPEEVRAVRRAKRGTAVLMFEDGSYEEFRRHTPALSRKETP